MGLGIKSRLLNPRDAVWDWRLGINTFGWAPEKGDRGSPYFQVHYSPTPYLRAKNAFTKAGLGADDVVLDLGCGLGRIVFLAAHMGARRARGVDLNADLVGRAGEMAARARIDGDRVSFETTPAEEAEVDDVTLVYMFHPFGAGTLQKVVTRLEQSLSRSPRSLRIIYENPVYDEVLETSASFERFAYWAPGAEPGSRYATSFWASA